MNDQYLNLCKSPQEKDCVGLENNGLGKGGTMVGHMGCTMENNGCLDARRDIIIGTWVIRQICHFETNL